MKEQENTGIRIVEHRQSIYKYISDSGECKERNPKRATPTTNEIRAGCMHECIMNAKYRDIKRERENHY